MKISLPQQHLAANKNQYSEAKATVVAEMSKITRSVTI